MSARALSLNLTAGMWLVGTRAEGGPNLLTERMQVGVTADYHKSGRAAARLPLSALAAAEERTRPVEVGLFTQSLTHSLTAGLHELRRSGTQWREGYSSACVAERSARGRCSAEAFILTPSCRLCLGCRCAFWLLL